MPLDASSYTCLLVCRWSVWECRGFSMCACPGACMPWRVHACLHAGVRKKVGFKYDPSEDTASALAQEMVENLSLNASEAEAIAAMIQHEVNRVQHKQQQAAAAGSGAGAEEPGQEGGAGQAQEEGGGGGALAAIAAITAAAAAASAVAAEEEEADKAAAAAAAAQVVVAAPARADLPVPPRQ